MVWQRCEWGKKTFVFFKPRKAPPSYSTNRFKLNFFFSKFVLLVYTVSDRIFSACKSNICAETTKSFLSSSQIRQIVQFYKKKIIQNPSEWAVEVLILCRPWLIMFTSIVHCFELMEGHRQVFATQSKQLNEQIVGNWNKLIHDPQPILPMTQWNRR